MDGYVTIGTEIDTKSFEKQIGELEKELRTLEKRYEETRDMKPFKGQEEDLQSIGLEIEKVNNKLVTMKKRQADLSENGLSNIQDGVGDIGKSIEGITKKVVRWGLAIFGIRGAYNLIRSSMNTILAQDAQLSADVEYMRNVIAYTLEPVIRRIIDLMKTLLSYVGYIIKAWTGKDIFANANKNLGKANKSAKQLQKTLSGFDEINIIGQQDTGGGGGAGATPNMPTIEDQDAPTWLKWIAENGGTVLEIIFGLIGALAGLKLGLGGIQSLGIGLAIIGIIGSIQSIIDLINDPSFDNFIEVLKNIALAVTGVAIAIGAWPVALIASLVYVVALLIKYRDKVAEIFLGIVTWINNKFIKPVVKFFKGMIDTIISAFKTIITSVSTTIGDTFKKVINAVIKAIETILNTPIKAINKLIGIINKIPGVSLGTIPTFSLPRLAKGGIINLPGQGVSLGSAIGGEKGKEGVLPLTDQQVMAQLGQEIAKNIVINANITNTMNGRIISRELQRVQNDNDFAFNR